MLASMKDKNCPILEIAISTIDVLWTMLIRFMSKSLIADRGHLILIKDLVFGMILTMICVVKIRI